MKFYALTTYACACVRCDVGRARYDEADLDRRRSMLGPCPAHSWARPGRATTLRAESAPEALAAAVAMWDEMRRRASHGGAPSEGRPFRRVCLTCSSINRDDAGRCDQCGGDDLITMHDPEVCPACRGDCYVADPGDPDVGLTGGAAECQRCQGVGYVGKEAPRCSA